jgi:hypothetical protein
MIVRYLGLCLSAALLAACALSTANPATNASRFTSVATALHPDMTLSLLARQQIVTDLGVALRQRGAFGRVLTTPPAKQTNGVLLVDIRLLTIQRLSNRINVSAQVDLVNFATGERIQSFAIGASGSRDSDLGRLSVSVIGDLVEQIADVVARPTSL